MPPQESGLPVPPHGSALVVHDTVQKEFLTDDEMMFKSWRSPWDSARTKALRILLYIFHEMMVCWQVSIAEVELHLHTYIHTPPKKTAFNFSGNKPYYY
jgi:hypothetical protein